MGCKAESHPLRLIALQTSQSNIICECQDYIAAPFCSLALTTLLILLTLNCPRGYYCAAPMRHYARFPLLLITLLQGIFHSSIFSEWLAFICFVTRRLIPCISQRDKITHMFVEKTQELFKPFASVRKPWALTQWHRSDFSVGILLCLLKDNT